MTTTIYNRFDPAKDYEDHRFVAGRPLQSAELNEIQAQARYKLQGVADALLKDGNIIRDAGIVVHPSTGVTDCESGAVYLRGAVRGVLPATITVPSTAFGPPSARPQTAGASTAETANQCQRVRWHHSITGSPTIPLP